MNKDQVKGTQKAAPDKAQDRGGKMPGNEMPGNETQHGKGQEKRADGKSGQSFGDAKDVIKDAVKKH